MLKGIWSMASELIETETNVAKRPPVCKILNKYRSKTDVIAETSEFCLLYALIPKPSYKRCNGSKIDITNMAINTDKNVGTSFFTKRSEEDNKKSMANITKLKFKKF